MMSAGWSTTHAGAPVIASSKCWREARIVAGTGRDRRRLGEGYAARASERAYTPWAASRMFPAGSTETANGKTMTRFSATPAV